MQRLIRFTLSGLIGLIIVAALFIFMGLLIDGKRQPNQSTALAVQDIKFETIQAKPKAKTVEVTKPKKELPKQQEAIALKLTETGTSEVGLGSSDLANEIGSKFGSMSAGTSDGTEQGGGNFQNNIGLTKYYEHNFKFPKNALNAGIMNGRLDFKAVFNSKHEFLRFEILHESTAQVFREVMYQFDYSKNSANHLRIRDYKRHLKHQFNDAQSEYAYKYQFLFDQNNQAEPVRFYRSNFFYTN